MLGLFLVLGGSLGGFSVAFGMLFMGSSGAVVFVELLGAIRTFEFMAFAGNGKHGYGHEQHGE